MFLRTAPKALLAGCALLCGCSSDSSSGQTPTCTDSIVDAGDYFGTGTQQYNGDTYPICPDPLPECPANSQLPACARQTSSNPLCVCCEAFWYCLSNGSGS